MKTNELDLSSLFYTFSTIAQVLGSFIALSGVFVIFKLQELKKMQLFQIQLFINKMSGIHKNLPDTSTLHCPAIAERLKILWESQYIGGMQDEMEKILKDPFVNETTEKSSLVKLKRRFDNINGKKNLIILYSKLSFFFGLLTIVFSLFVLANSKNILSAATCFFTFGFIGTILTLITMGFVIYYSLEESNFIFNNSSNN